jgi:hypothetical protein
VAVSRRLILWLVTLPLAVAGTQMAHALAYRVVSPDAGQRAHELSATGHAYLAYLPLMLAVGTVLVVLALATEIRHIVAAPRRSGFRPSAWGFAALAPATFVCQEHFERLVHDGGFPWDAALASSFVVGLLLQLPFALAAYALARFLLRVARSLGRLLAGRSRPRRIRPALPRPVVRVEVPRLPALALGYGSRGPPALPAV